MNLNGKVINPGELRTAVTLGTRTITTGAGGAQSVSFTAGTTVFAKWTNVHGAESVKAAAEGVQRQATVLIRYRASLDETMGVRLGSDWYEIVSMDDIQQRGEYVELQVKLWRAA